MNFILIVLFIWSLLSALRSCFYSIIFVINYDMSQFGRKVFSTFMYSIVFIDSFLRLFSTNSTGLW